jgi:hypothetical protein
MKEKRFLKREKEINTYEGFKPKHCSEIEDRYSMN